jgi:translation initiation factor IF-2
MLIKYRVHEVAKDFKLSSKEIGLILTQYATTPKNHMQVLTEPELDLIFEYLTQHNQLEDISEVFNVPEPEPVKDEAPVSTETKPSDEKPGEAKPAAATEPKKPAQAQATPPAPKKEKENKPHVPKLTPEKRIIDTRGATVNIEKYDERLDNFVPERAERMKSGREKFQNKGKNRPVPSNKRKQEERD